MKIKGIKERDENDDDDDDEEDIFHDASDDFDSFSASPSKARGEKGKTEMVVDATTDPLDLLLSSLEKITVSDGHEKDSKSKSGLSDAPLNEKKSPSPASESRGTLSGEKIVLQAQESNIKNVIEKPSSLERKGSFQDPEFNPFLIGTPGDKSSKVGDNSHGENSLLSSSSKKSECKISNPNDSEVLSGEALLSRAEDPSEKNGDVIGTESQSPDHNIDTLTSKRTVVPSLDTKECNPEVSGKKVAQEVGDEVVQEVTTPVDPGSNETEDSDLHPSSKIVSSPDSVVPQVEHTVAEGGAELGSQRTSPEEMEIIPLKAGYGIEKVLQSLDDPTFNPFESKSCVLNSPDLEGIVQGGSKGKETLTDFAVDGLTVEEATAVQPKRYSFELAPHLMKDPKFDPFVSKDLIVNSPDLVKEATQNLSTAPKESICETPKGEILPECLQGFPEESTNSKEMIVESGKNEMDANGCSTSAAVMNSPSEGQSTITEKSPKEADSQEHKSHVLERDHPIAEKLVVGVEVSPKRKYDEAFADDKEDCDEELLANEMGITSSDADREERELNMESADSAGDQALESQEETIPPKKSYNMDILENLHDPNINPFATKTTVMNSPDGKNSVSVKEDLKLNNEDGEVVSEKEKSAAQEVVGDEEMRNLPSKTEGNVSKVSSEVNSKDLAASEISLCTEISRCSDSSRSAVEENQSKPVVVQNEDESEMALPKKGYQLDFLDNLDDPNFNPFATKTSVMNSPNRSKEDAKPPAEKSEEKTAELCVQDEKKACEQESTKKRPEESSKSSTNKTKVVRRKLKAPLKKDVPKTSESESKSAAKEEEGISVPKKSYQLDFLDKLDDPNYNPFESKAAVSNSPKKDHLPAKEEKENPSTEENDGKNPVKKEVKSQESKLKQKSLESLQHEEPSKIADCGIISKPDIQTPLEKDINSTGEQQEEVSVVPSKNNPSDFLKDMDDPNFNPFATKSAVMNSPEKLETTATTKREAELEVGLKQEPLTAKCEESSSSVTQTSTGEQQEEVSVVPSKNNPSDFLKGLDDPNFNPFAAKSTVMNSPEKLETAATTKREAELEVGLKQETLTAKCEEPSSSVTQTPKGKSKGIPSTKPTANSITCPPPVKEPISPTEDSDIYEMIAKEAMKLVSDITPSKKRFTHKKASQATTQARQRDVFSPLLSQSSRSPDPSVAYDEEFVNATSCKYGFMELLIDSFGFMGAVCFS